MSRTTRVFCILMCWSFSAWAAESDSYTTLVSDFYSLYSPEVFGDQLWAGGWMERPKSVPWPDKIYSSIRSNKGEWSFPKPISILDADGNNQAGEVAGYHINDPSVVMLSKFTPNKLLMFYTAFPNDAIDPSACNPARNPIDCLDVKRHAMGALQSSDAGHTWHDLGVILEHPQGVWSASVLSVENELWVYYMDATMPLEDSSLYLQRLHAASFLALGKRTKINHPEGGIGNPDVHKINGQFVLLGNRSKASQVVRYESSNGYQFSQSECWRQPLIDRVGIRLDGPSVYTSTDDEIVVLTGFNEKNGSTQVVAWSVTSECNVIR